MTDTTDKLCQAISHQFIDPGLLSLALTHRSVGQENNERLEYLGDALLGAVIAEAIYHQFPTAPEGELTRLRANLVKKETLAKLARTLEIGRCIHLGSGELKSGGWRRDSILSNTFEAIIGAVYLDSDYDTCRKCLLEIYHEMLGQISPDNLSKDPKTQLQEYLQARKISLPVYTVVKEEGLAHSREFTVECKVENMGDPICATGRSKRSAEQFSAQETLNLLQSENS